MEEIEINRIILGLIIISIMMIIYILSGYSIDTTTLPVKITKIENVVCNTKEEGDVNCYENKNN